MSKPGNNSAEVVRFLTLFERLKDWSDNDPASLPSQAKGDESVRELCDKLFYAGERLRTSERRSRPQFAAPVDPAFLKAWRDYEDRYETVVQGILLSGIFDIAPPDPGTGEPVGVSKADQQWSSADDDAAEQSSGINDAMDFAQFNVDQDWRWEDQPKFAERIQEGIAAWERLTQDTGFDLHGVFRRRALVPFVLVPRNVAAKHGSAEVLSMLKNLQQAHDAFVFGATYAALALMRSIMEAVLRDHYRAEGKDLVERIRNARGRLPPGAGEAALHRLRKLANAVLHLDRERDEGLPKMDEMRLEKEIVSLLFVLRALIEGAK